MIKVMNKTKQNVSIVIPVYNEQDYLVACLEAIARQTVKPLEVIVVDNNSQDATVDIAGSFPFVTIIQEMKQGVTHARNRGFDAARGDIIGRIDADTVLPPGWVERAQEIFTDSSLAAVTGSLHYYDTPWSPLIDGVDLLCRKWLTLSMANYFYLQGSNMALRREAWLAVRDQTCIRQLHEDQDLAIHLGELGCKVTFVPELHAAVSGRCIDTSPLNFWRYAYANVDTYAQHSLSEQRAMYPIVAIIVFFYVPLRIMQRGFNTNMQRFQWRRVLMTHDLARVNPVTFITTAD